MENNKTVRVHYQEERWLRRDGGYLRQELPVERMPEYVKKQIRKTTELCEDHIRREFARSGGAITGATIYVTKKLNGTIKVNVR